MRCEIVPELSLVIVAGCGKMSTDVAWRYVIPDWLTHRHRQQSAQHRTNSSQPRICAALRGFFSHCFFCSPWPAKTGTNSLTDRRRKIRSLRIQFV